VLEIAVGPHLLPQHEADVPGVVHDRIWEPPVQFIRQRRLARAEPAVDQCVSVPGCARLRTAGRARGESGPVTGPVAGGAAELEVRLASFVTDNRLYGGAADVVHSGERRFRAGTP
jgi:hypothetical protein